MLVHHKNQIFKQYQQPYSKLTNIYDSKKRKKKKLKPINTHIQNQQILPQNQILQLEKKRILTGNEFLMTEGLEEVTFPQFSFWVC